MKQRWKHHLTTILLVLVFVIGILLLLYPTLSDYWNSIHQSRAITSYLEDVGNIDDEEYEQVWKNAILYNEELAEKGNGWVLTAEEYEHYKKQLNISSSGVLGCVEIPKLEVFLPIYHGTEEAVLQKGVGHLEGSSLPTGGDSTHCVLSGHRGLPSTKLFTKLDEMEVGDTFMLRIMDKVLTYEVDQIRIVNPKDVSALVIEEDKDFCTLVTCTPYGINSHRLLVRGTRVENNVEIESLRIVADAMPVDELVVASIVGAIILIILMVGILTGTRKRK